jgi:diguanylate cyclase (GGDEF)-like protein
MFKQKKRLITVLSILLIAGFLLTSLASYFISLASLRHQVTHSELPLTSDNIYSEIQRDLLRPIFISSLMASDTFLRDWVINGEQSPDAIIRYLKEIQETYGTITSFFVSEHTRNYYHPNGLVKQIQPEEARDSWYFRLRDLTDDYEINVDIDMANNDALTVFINYRVYDYEKNFIGAVGVGLTVNSVRQLINRYQQTYDRNIVFIDRQGHIKLSNSSTKQMSQHAKELQNLTQDKEFLDKITATDSASLQYKLQGHPLSLNTRFIKEFGWYLVVSQSELKGAGNLVKTLLVNLLFCAIITGIVLVITNRTISSYQKDIEQMATTDELTGLYNRQALDMLFKPLILDKNRTPYDLSLLLLDVDHFKQVNDEYGHLAGDAVLEHLAKLITSRLRETDIICRWGGEEFLILLKGCNLETASNMAEELRLSIMNHPLYYQKQMIKITTSIGVSEYQQQDTRKKLIGRADRALYEAKVNGRNQVVSA